MPGTKRDATGRDGMTFEREIASLNEHFFFEEFTYSTNTFRPNPSTELELADSIIWLDDMLVLFQLKEREKIGKASPDQEARWFEKKVIGVGTRQIRDSVNYLDAHRSIRLRNHRGHEFELRRDAIAGMHKVICYLGNDRLPESCRRKKFHCSRTAGTIHVIAAHDYLGVVRTVLTPFELSEYLAFRQELIEKWGDAVSPVPEPALVGQYLEGNADRKPDPAFVDVLKALEHRADEWDMSGIIKQFAERVTTDGPATEYYAILKELAKLKRNELRVFKTRFRLSMEKCRLGEFALPYRMASPRTDCGFVFIPLTEDVVEVRQRGLMNLTLACKYDLKVQKCVGASFAPENGGLYSVEWCYIEHPWGYEEEFERALKGNNPFREIRTVELPRYGYRGEA